MCNGLLFAQTGKFDFSEETDIYTKVPDLVLNTESGTFNLSEFYSKSPVMVALIFTRCVGICSPFIFNLQDNTERIKTKRDYKILVISFDPRDSLQDMINYKSRFKFKNENRWIFATTEQIDEMNKAFSFNPEWDEGTQQFEHEALLVGLNENGYLTKKLLGLREADAVSAVIKSIHNEFTLSYPLPMKNRLLTCFTYDPVTGKKKASFGLFVLILPVVLTATVVLIIQVNRRRKEDE